LQKKELNMKTRYLMLAFLLTFSVPNSAITDNEIEPLSSTRPIIIDISPDYAGIGESIKIIGARFGDHSEPEGYISSADFNNDGVIDGKDLGILEDNFDINEGKTQLTGDANGDGVNDYRDYLTVKMGFGKTCGDSYVEFKNGVKLRILSWSDNRIDCKIPDNAISQGVCVVTPGGRSNYIKLPIISGSADRAYQHLEWRMDSYQRSGMRLIQSFWPSQPGLNYTAFSYDNALAAIALLIRKKASDIARAKDICKAFQWAQDRDQNFSDGRVRDAYWSTNIKNPSGRYSSINSPGSGTGNMAWVILAWMHYYRYSNDTDTAFLNSILQSAERLGEFIETNCRDAGNPGYRGGFEYRGGTYSTVYRSYWKNVEHNAAVYAAFMHLYSATGDPVWLERAENALDIVESRLWDPENNMFWVGTQTDGWSLNTGYYQQVVDANCHPLIVLNDYSRYGGALDWIEMNCGKRCEIDQTGNPHHPFDGFDFNRDKDGVWFEGTAQMVLAYKMNGLFSKALYYQNEIEKSQDKDLFTPYHGASGHDGYGIPAACHIISTGFNWEYYPILHIGATSWFIAADAGYNIFWGWDDIIPPTVGLSGIEEGEHVYGEISLFARANDNSVLKDIDLYIDDALVANSDTTELALVCDTTQYNDGEHSIKVSATDISGNIASVNNIVTFDNTAPNINITYPEDGQIVAGPSMVIEGNIDDESARVTIGTIEATVSNLYFSAENVPLGQGNNNIAIIAVDEAGNASSVTINVIRDDTAVIPPYNEQPTFSMDVAGDVSGLPETTEEEPVSLPNNQTPLVKAEPEVVTNRVAKQSGTFKAINPSTIDWDVTYLRATACPDMAIDRNGTPHFSYGTSFSYAGGFDLVHAYIDNGVLVEETVGSAGDGCGSTNIHFSSTDDLHICYAVHYGTGVFHLKKLQDGTQSVITIKGKYALNGVASFLDSDDRMHVIYGDSDDRAFEYSYETAAARQYQTIIGKGVDYLLYPSCITVDHDGVPHILCEVYGSSYLTKDSYYFYRANGRWIRTKIQDIHPAFSNAFIRNNTLAVDSKNRLYMLLARDVTSGSSTKRYLTLAIKDGDNWTYKDIKQLDVQDFSIALDSRDNVHVLFATEDKAYYGSNNMGAWRFSTVAIGNYHFNIFGDVGRIAIDSSGTPHIMGIMAVTAFRPGYWDELWSEGYYNYLYYATPRSGNEKFKNPPVNPNVTVTEEGGSYPWYILNMNAEGAKQMIIGFNPTFKDAEWEDYCNIRPLGLSDREGVNNLYIKFRGNNKSVQTKPVHLKIVHENRPPYFHSGPAKYSQKYGKPVEFTLTAFDLNDLDDEENLSFYMENAPDGAVLNPETGKFKWTPKIDQVGTYTIDFFVTDSDLSAKRQVDIEVVDNLPPVFNQPDDDWIYKSAYEGQELTYTFKAIDPEKRKIIYSLRRAPSGASIDSAKGVFSWTPDFDQERRYAFEVIASDGELEASVDFEINVYNTNRAPVIGVGENYVMTEGEELSIALNVYDPDGDDYVLFPDPYHDNPGFITLDDQKGDERIICKPSYTDSGTHQISLCCYDVKEDRWTRSTSYKRVDLVVNNYVVAPEIEPIGEKVAERGQMFELYVNATDPNNDLRYLIKDKPKGASFNGKTGCFRWKPGLKQNGEYYVTFIANSREGGEDSTAAKIIVPSSPPILTFSDNSDIIMCERGVTLELLILGHDDDTIDRDHLAYTVTNKPKGATLLKYTNRWRRLKWTPSFKQSGDYPVTFTVKDRLGLLVQKTVILSVKPNNPPELSFSYNGGDFNWYRGKTLSFKIYGKDDDEIDKDSLVYVIDNIPKGARVYRYYKKWRELRWTPAYNQVGDFLLTFTVKDNLGEMVKKDITISITNQPPVLGNIVNRTILRGNTLSYSIPADDSDYVDKTGLRYFMDNKPKGAALNQKSGLFKWKPADTQAGEFQIAFIVKDKIGAQDSKTVTITVPNIIPHIDPIGNKTVNRGEHLEFYANGIDPDEVDAKLVYSIENKPKGALFYRNTGKFKWKPAYNQAGVYNVTFIVKDKAGFEDRQTITITVPNTVPTLAPIGNKTAVRGELMEFLIEGADPDPIDSKLKYVITNKPKGALFYRNSGKFRWKPALTQSGQFEVTFTVKDKAGTEDSETIIIKVPNNDPVLRSIGSRTINAGEVLKFVINAEDTDQVDSKKLKYYIDGRPGYASFRNIRGTRTFSWKPRVSQKGNYQVRFYVKDLAGAIAEETIVIIVQ